VDYGDGHRQTNGTSRHQYYTAYFSRNYTRYGRYNVSARCYNERSTNTTEIVRTVRREQMNRKQMIYKDLMEMPSASRFNLLSREDYSFRHANCLHLRHVLTNDTMKLIWRKKTLEIILNEVQTRFAVRRDETHGRPSLSILGVAHRQAFLSIGM
jgi:hypothetical protein